MNESIITMLRNTRTALQVALEPIDWIARRANHKRGFPPLYLRQSVGDLRDFEGSGGEYLVYLKLFLDMEPGQDILDLGCGCGLMCLPVGSSPPIPSYIYPGLYLGVDINRRAIEWCRRNVRQPNASFAVTHNNHIPAASSSVDVMLAKSLFTHLLPDEADTYLREIARVLRPGGRGLITFFIIEDKLEFFQSGGPIYYKRPSRPRLAVGYDLNWIAAMTRKAGLLFEHVEAGTWKGQAGLSYQDLVIIHKEHK